MLKPDNFIQRDLQKWLLVNFEMHPDQLDAPGFVDDLFAHADPDLSLGAADDLRNIATVTSRDEWGDEMVNQFSMVDDEPREVGFHEALRHVPDQRVVSRAVAAYRNRGAVGVRLCPFAEFEDYRPAGLTVPIKVTGSVRETLRFDEWQAIVLDLAGNISAKMKLDGVAARASEFNVAGWAVELFNALGYVPLGDSRVWVRLDGSMDVWGMLEDFTLTDNASRELARRNELRGGRGQSGAKLEWADSNELAGLSGGNFGWRPKR